MAKIAASVERSPGCCDAVGHLRAAVVHYGTYVHCAGVHVYREETRADRDALLNKVNSARRMMHHRMGLEATIRKSVRAYAAPGIKPPAQLAVSSAASLVRQSKQKTSWKPTNQPTNQPLTNY